MTVSGPLPESNDDQSDRTENARDSRGMGGTDESAVNGRAEPDDSKSDPVKEREKPVKETEHEFNESDGSESDGPAKAAEAIAEDKSEHDSAGGLRIAGAPVKVAGPDGETIRMYPVRFADGTLELVAEDKLPEAIRPKERKPVKINIPPWLEKSFPIAAKVLSYALTVLFAVLLVFILYSTAFGDEVNGVPIGPFNMFVVLTGSMEPVISQGSMVVTMGVPGEQLEVGDIITYYPMTGYRDLVTHRIINHDREAGQITTRGELPTSVNDRPIGYDVIVGRVLFSIPVLGEIVESLSSPFSTAMAIMSIILLLLIVATARRLVRLYTRAL